MNGRLASRIDRLEQANPAPSRPARTFRVIGPPTGDDEQIKAFLASEGIMLEAGDMVIYRAIIAPPDRPVWTGFKMTPSRESRPA